MFIPITILIEKYFHCPASITINPSILKINIFAHIPYIDILYFNRNASIHTMEKFYFYERFQFRCATFMCRTHRTMNVYDDDHQLRQAGHHYRVPIFHSLHRTQSLSCAKINQPCARSGIQPSPPSDAYALHKFPIYVYIPNRVVKVPAHHIYYVFRPCQAVLSATIFIYTISTIGIHICNEMKICSNLVSYRSTNGILQASR